MLVRAATLDDARRIAEVHVLSWQSGYRGLLPQALLDGLDPRQRIPRWTSTLEQADWPCQGVLVVESETVVVGFTQLCPSRDEDQDPAEVGEISSFYVVPDAWGHGFGRQLMTAAVDALGTAGFASAALWVLEGNVRARRFYARTGWTPDGGVKDDVMGGAAIRDLRYRRTLAT